MDRNNEKTHFLDSSKPVTLSPSWEAQKLPDDDLNFKGMGKVQHLPLKPPVDKWKLVFLIFLIHGLGTLMPWNMFITAKSYFEDFKLASPNANETTVYASNFMQYIGFASQIPNLIFNWLNIFVHLGGDLTKRIVYSILFELLIFIVTVLMAILDSSSWQDVFFWITMISVVLLNMANGIYQNTIYGMAATLPIKYTGAVVLGSNISGLFASIVSICSKYIFSSDRTSAIYYFITAMLILLICFDTYFALPLTQFYRYHTMLRRKEEKPLTNQPHQSTKVPYGTVLKQAAPQLFNIFFTFFITLSVFPAIHSDIKAVATDFVIPPELFASITCFLTFNLFAMLGSLTTSWIQWPKPRFLVVPVVLRVVFIPLFLLCNYLPKGIDRTLPVVITNEWVYWIIGIVMSYSSGYLSSLGMMYAPQTVQPKHQLTAGMFAAAMLITGIFSGILFSFVMPSLVAL
ncbi:equilibrative nucleoside transporter 1 [Stomoxys calcitrans]|uniref:Equilibrative nucleoside transporter 1 n=1 Tax=Stomoxys calcitrans TaxID=35570 RepID=A0A1I8PKL2_STOCA|nr:equilibrative nucleoside transporter 1 [Stomoxys calcitrans]XP_013110542.1 equilibrative nucleoside transporter 1 [Stomoxys calcitrans]